MMKPLTLLLCLFLLGCEKRIADPELEAVREWLLREDGKSAFLKNESIPKWRWDDLAPCGDWRVKRFANSGTEFLFYFPLKSGDRGLIGRYGVEFDNTSNIKVSALEQFRGRPFSLAVFENYGDPVDRRSYRQYREFLFRQNRCAGDVVIAWLDKNGPDWVRAGEKSCKVYFPGPPSIFRVEVSVKNPSGSGFKRLPFVVRMNGEDAEIIYTSSFSPIPK